MTRRVIFVDPDLWTNHKEHTMTNDDVTSTDIRLASALTKHHRTGNTAGMHEIVRTTVDTDRGAPLLVALMDLHARYIVDTRTNVGVDFLAVHVQAIGDIEPTDDPVTVDLHRACLIFDGHGRADYDQINDMLQAAVDDERSTHTVIALLNLYQSVLPELSSPAGQAWLDACIAAMLSEEGKEQ